MTESYNAENIGDYLKLIDQIRDDVPDYDLLVAINNIQKAGTLA